MMSLLMPCHDAAGRRGYHFNLHEGQQAAMNSRKRVVLVLAGTRGGKTSLGPLWLWREMRRKGPGDYLVAGPTHTLLQKAAVPELERVFGRILGLGRVCGQPFEFRISSAGEEKLWGRQQERPTRIIFGHADKSESLEAMTAKAVWLDEVGQKQFRLESWEAVWRRTLTTEGRFLLTTTPYNLGWLKVKVHDEWVKAKRNHPDFDVIQFDSTKNPAVPPEELERAKQTLPSWRYEMFYLGRFTRPAGVIYDNFSEVNHCLPKFTIEPHWPRYLGLDFGGINTVGIFFAKEPFTNRLYAYREYRPKEGRTAKEHVAALRQGEVMLPCAVGGSASEDQWRNEFAAAGLPVHPSPLSGPDSVEVGINRAYALIARDRLRVLPACEYFLQDLLTYSRELDDTGEPTEKIQDKESMHFADAFRYLAGYLHNAERDVGQPFVGRKLGERK